MKNHKIRFLFLAWFWLAPAPWLFTVPFGFYPNQPVIFWLAVARPGDANKTGQPELKTG